MPSFELYLDPTPALPQLIAGLHQPVVEGDQPEDEHPSGECRDDNSDFHKNGVKSLRSKFGISKYQNRF